jgi:hypothetical protein
MSLDLLREELPEHQLVKFFEPTTILSPSLLEPPHPARPRAQQGEQPAAHRPPPAFGPAEEVVGTDRQQGRRDRAREDQLFDTEATPEDELAEPPAPIAAAMVATPSR